MSRRRYLSTKISQDAKINRLAVQHGDFAALLYTWMIPHVEDDATLSGDPEEILMTVIPGRRDKTVADVEHALTAMHDIGLIVWTRDDPQPLVTFPASFYTYQSYITAERRSGAQSSNDAASRAGGSADDNVSAQISANQRKSAQNASSFKSSVKSKSSVKITSSVRGTDATPQETPVVESMPQEGASAPQPRTVNPSQPQQPRNEWWDALVGVFGYSPRTEAERKKWGKVIHDIRAANASGADIQRAKANYDAAVEQDIINWTLTPTALAAHLGELLQTPRPIKPSRPRAAIATGPREPSRFMPTLEDSADAIPVNWRNRPALNGATTGAANGGATTDGH